MEKFKIVGPNRLQGELKIEGAKNAALPILCASLLSSEDIRITNVPNLRDVRTMCDLLKKIGVNVKEDLKNGVCALNASKVSSIEAPYDLVKTMRASILVLGPLLSRHGEARVSLPGGCAIGQRPVDQHLKALEQMGAEVSLVDGYIHAKAKKLFGSRIVNDLITVTGTENIMMAACLADGTTIIENAAREPEVVDLAKFLRSMGAKIQGDGTNIIQIDGVKNLIGVDHEIIFDRIEAATFMCAVAACGGEIFLDKIDLNLMGKTYDKLQECGGTFSEIENGVLINFKKRPKAVSFETKPFPGFATDMQAQLMAVNCIADGVSVVKEKIFENRFMHVQEMRRLGAKIEVDGSAAIINGRDKLNGAKVMATDLRASAGLVIASLAAEGESIIDRIYHLDRGYSQMDTKLIQLGAKVQRIS